VGRVWSAAAERQELGWGWLPAWQPVSMMLCERGMGLWGFLAFPFVKCICVNGWAKYGRSVECIVAAAGNVGHYTREVC
jgi:hypothetical protein